MPFDISTAKPVGASGGGFDISTAKPVADAASGSPDATADPKQATADAALKGFHENNFGSGVMKALDEGAYKAGEIGTDIGTTLGLPPKGAAGLGLAANVGTQALPALLGGEAAKAASPAFRKGAEELMQSAIKPTIKQLKTGDAAQAISTMLDEGVSVTRGGMEKLRGKIDELNNQIKSSISNSRASVKKSSVVKGLQDTIDKFKNQVTPQSDIGAIKQAWDDFINHPMLQNGDLIPVQLAQKLKQGTYKALSGKYGEVGSASTEAQKTLARGLKEGVAQAVPKVRALNAEESKLINALNVGERRVLLDANKNPAGLGWLTVNPEKFAAWMADRSPLFKSLVARMLNAGKEQIPANAARAVGTGAQVLNGKNRGDQPQTAE